MDICQKLWWLNSRIYFKNASFSSKTLDFLDEHTLTIISRISESDLKIIVDEPVI